MKEKLVRGVIEYLFVVRYWVVLFFMGVLGYATYKVYYLPNSQLRDTVAVFTGGSVLITVFYHIINYEYTQRKFKYDIKTSKDVLSFNIAMEWQKEFLSKSTSRLYDFYTQHKAYLEDNQPRKFQEELDKPQNKESYDSLLSVINFLESISLAVKQGIMDEEFIKGFFQSVFINQYNRYIIYIEYRRREKQNVRIWNNFTELSQKWLIC